MKKLLLFTFVTISIFVFTVVLYQINSSKLVSTVNAAPPTTGNTAVDWVGLPGLQVLTDGATDIGIDLDVLAAGGSTANVGWNILKHYYYYDSALDEMYVGIECAGICGDSDGNGDPTATWPNPPSNVPAIYDNNWTSEYYQMKLNSSNNQLFIIQKLQLHIRVANGPMPIHNFTFLICLR